MPNLHAFLIIVSAVFCSSLAYADTNLTTCLSGKYPALCDKSRLTPDQLDKTNKAEHRENLALCLIGKYPALCHHELLTTAEARRVDTAELRENLRMCLIGKYAALCNHGLLKLDEAVRVQQSEAREAAKMPKVSNRPASRQRYTASGGCEAGHWVESVSDDGGIVKLEDGSIWQVDSVDAIDSNLWLPTTDIVACDSKLINTEDNETVQATRLR